MPTAEAVLLFQKKFFLEFFSVVDFLLSFWGILVKFYNFEYSPLEVAENWAIKVEFPAIKKKNKIRKLINPII